MWFVYVLLNKNETFRYIGSTNNLSRRLEQHNKGKVQSTKSFHPFKIEAYIAVQSELQARKLEKYFKTGSGKAILNKRILGLSPKVYEA